jgi:hypothetical protein
MTATIGRDRVCLPGERWCDSSSPLIADLARHAAAAGFTGWIRYLGLRRRGGSDLSPAEVQLIHESGLDLQLVQRSRLPGWTPAALLGRLDGEAAAAQATALGAPTGISIWCDLESVASHASAADVDAYCRAWWAAVDGADYLAGLYVGCACGLSAEQLWRLPFTRYWKSASTVPDPLPRSYCLLQKHQEMWHGIYIDRDDCCGDALGGCPVAWSVR